MSRKRLVSIPLLFVVLLIASCTFNNSFIRAFIAANAPTSTPVAQLGNVTERIQFAAGATSTQLTGQIDGNSFHTYLVEARAGQRMQARVASPSSNVFLTLVSPSGSPLARAQAGAQSFDGTLPETGDYTLQISSPVGTALTTYLLNVSITGGVPTSTPIPAPQFQRIRFPAGSTSATINDQISGTTFDGYLLEARAGQRMQIAITSPTGNAYLTVVSPSGTPLARAQNGVQNFDQTLPETGDYQLTISAPAGTPVINYSLFVSVTDTQPGGITQRIRFASGATSAQVSGRIDGLSMDTYLLEARAGQFMQVFVTSPTSEAYLTVVSPGGSPLARAQAGAQSFSGTLPETGDYRLVVSSPSGTAHTTYTLTVSVTGSTPPTPTQPTGVQRIRFAPGTSGTTVSGAIPSGGLIGYVLAAGAGQRMQLALASPGGNVFLSVFSPSGQTLASATLGEQSLDRFLSETGDYTIQVTTLPGTPATNYSLTVAVIGGQPVPPTGQPTQQQPTVPPPPDAQRITFAPGTTTAQVSGQVGGSTVIRYLLAAGAGQNMQVSVSSPTNNVFLSVLTPSGAFLAQATAGAKSFTGVLPQTGDYTFRVSTSPGAATTSYTLSVTVTGAGQPLPPTPTQSQPQPTSIPPAGTVRIRFAAGATSATVTGQVDSSASRNYVLGANSGQRMTIMLSSPGSNVYLTVLTPSGVMLANAALGESSLDHFLPESGDYTIQISTPGGATNFTLTVSVV